MIRPKPGEVYWVDLGMQAKFRPLLVVSREDLDAERALAVCMPCTTEIRGGRYEVVLPQVRLVAWIGRRSSERAGHDGGGASPAGAPRGAV